MAYSVKTDKLLLSYIFKLHSEVEELFPATS